MTKLPVIEMFGPTIQGEGAAIGLKTMFVRTYGCDYKCSWCDSAFTWNGSAKADVLMLESKEIIERLHELGMQHTQYVTISGGNPALHDLPLQQLIMNLHAIGKKVIVETQGSLWRDWFTEVDLLTLSPKPPSSGMITNWDLFDSIIRQLRLHEHNFVSYPYPTPSNISEAVLTQSELHLTHLIKPIMPDISIKVVVFDDVDFEYAKKVHQQYPSIPFYLQVGNDEVHQQNDISARLLNQLEWLFHKVIADESMSDVRALPQLHTLVWSNKRGK